MGTCQCLKVWPYVRYGTGSLEEPAASNRHLNFDIQQLFKETFTKLDMMTHEVLYFGRTAALS